MNANGNVPKLVTAPNKTLAAPAPTTFKRPSNYTNNETKSKSSSTMPRSPSLELSDSFSALTSLSPTNAISPTNKYSAGPHYAMTVKSPTEQHHPFFSTLQLAAIKPICTNSTVEDWSFLSLEKYPATHNA
jgi:hypothetical protein